MELINEKIGAEGSLGVKLSQGKLLVEAKHMHKSGSVSLVVEENADYFFDKLAAAIPGTIDDAVLALIKQAVKALP